MQAILATGSVYGPDRVRCEFFRNDFKRRITELCEGQDW